MIHVLKRLVVTMLFATTGADTDTMFNNTDIWFNVH